ncbi:MAG TPA: SulP family inorganic anion transporter [Promineifilum sp.]
MSTSTPDLPREYPSSKFGAELRPQRLITALLAGPLIGILEIALAVSFGALIFSGEAATHLSRGIGMALFSATIGIAVTTLLTSYPAIMGGNQDAPAAIVAVMAANITVLVADPEAMPATVIVMVALTTLLTALFLLGLGVFRLGGLVRFLPYPVAGGFLAGTGWLILAGGISTMARIPFSLTNLAALFEPGVAIYWLPGLLLGIAILAVSTRFHHFLIMPGMILAIIAGFYLLAAALGATPAELSGGGWLLGPFPEGRLWQPVTPAEFGQVEWPAIWRQIPNVVGVMIISAIALLLNASGLELELNRDLDLNREMRAAGVANLASSLGAGLIGYAQLSMSALTERLGAASRLTGLIAAAVCGITLLLGGSVLGFMPTIVFGALLAYLGLSFLWQWVVVARTRLPRIDYLIVLLILGIIALAGFLQGVAVGVVAAVTMFVVNYSRTSVVKYEQDITTFRSRVTRSPKDREILESTGDQAYILRLQGFIFFGTANALLEEVRSHVQRVETRFIVLDFEQVIGLDSTALMSFSKMLRIARENHITLILSGLAPELRWQFERGALVEETGVLQYLADLDRAAEWTEEQLCALHAVNGTTRTMTGYLQDIVPGAAIVKAVSYMERLELEAGDYLIRQGAAADDLFFIESGQVTAQLESPDKPPMRLETMRGGRAVGEMGFYMGMPRSAAVIADWPSVVYRLTTDSLARMEKQDPEAAHAVHRVIVSLMGERLLHLVRAVDVLQS